MKEKVLWKYYLQFTISGFPEVRKYPIIVADNENQESLEKMAKQAKVIINAVGPVSRLFVYKLHLFYCIRFQIHFYPLNLFFNFSKIKL